MGIIVRNWESSHCDATTTPPPPWTSILKRGIVTMPLSILRTTDPCSLPNSWHHPSMLLLSIPVLRGSLIMDEEQLFSDIKSHLQDYPISTACLDNQSDPKWTVTPNGLLHYSDRIYIPDHGNLRLRDLQYSHDHPLAGHFGQTKTLHTVQMQYTWPGLPVYIKDYCKLCTTCSHTKPVHHQPYGLLKQLPVLEKPWNSILLDFIEKLPPSSSGYTAILVIVDLSPSRDSSFQLTT